MPTNSREGRTENSRVAGPGANGQASSLPNINRNVAINLIGRIAPLGVGLFTIPVIIASLGIERFGVLTIAWMVIGYFNMFDVGLGRAITKVVAEYLATDREQELGQIIGSGIGAMLVFGGGGGVLAWMISPQIVHSILNIPEGLTDEAVGSFKLLAVSVPIVVVSIGLRGVLQAQQRFGAVNAVQVPVALNTFLGPVFVSLYTTDLRYVVGWLVAGRCLGVVGNALLVLRAMPTNTVWRIHGHHVRSLVKTGGWITVSNILSPILVYADRFIIGGTMTMAAVAFYSTPFEVVSKVLLISASISTVLFPAFSAGHAARAKSNIKLYWKGLDQIHFLVFPVLMLGALFSFEGLNVWLGVEFAQNGAIPLSILCFGVWMNSLGSIPFALIQGTGGAKTTALIHAIEAPAYLLVLMYMTSRYGLWGAAATWSLRVSVDAVVLHVLALRRLGSSTEMRWIGNTLMAAVVVLFLVMQPSFWLKVSLYLAILGTHLAVHRAVLRAAIGGGRPGLFVGQESKP